MFAVLGNKYAGMFVAKTVAKIVLRFDFYFQFAEESSTRVEFTSAGSIGPSFFASLHDILHRPLIAWPVQKERKYGSK